MEATNRWLPFHSRAGLPRQRRMGLFLPPTHCSQLLPQPRGFPKFPGSPGPARWGPDHPGGRLAWDGAGKPGRKDTLTSRTASAPTDISPRNPAAGRASGWARSGTAAEQHPLRPCPGARPCSPPARPGAKPGRAAWNQHPGERKTSFAGKTKAECKGNKNSVQAGCRLRGGALLWACVRAHRHGPRSVSPTPQTDSLFTPLHRQTEHDSIRVAGWMACPWSREPAGQWSGAGCRPPVPALPPTSHATSGQ